MAPRGWAYRLEIKQIRCAISTNNAPLADYPLIFNKMMPSTLEEISDTSGSAEPNGNLTRLDDHRNIPPPVRKRKHVLERTWIFLDIPVVNNDVSRCVVLTGRNCVGSGVFSKDQNFFGHLGHN
jgi:hypothetical protein